MNSDILEKISIINRAKAYLDKLETVLPDSEMDEREDELVVAKEIAKLEMEFNGVFQKLGDLENEYVTDSELIPLLIARESIDWICCYLQDLSWQSWGDKFIKCYLAEKDIELNSSTVQAIDEEIDSFISAVLRDLSEDAFDSVEAASYSISAFEISKESPEKIGEDGNVHVFNEPDLWESSVSGTARVPRITLDTPRIRSIDATDKLVELAKSLIKKAFDSENDYQLVRTIDCGTISIKSVTEILGAIITGHCHQEPTEIDLREALCMAEHLQSRVDENNRLRVDILRPDRRRSRIVKTGRDRDLSEVEVEFTIDFEDFERKLLKIRDQAREIASSATARDVIISKFLELM